VLTNPTVVLSSYQNGDTIPTNVVFRYEFDRPMDPGTVNSNTFYFCDNSLGCQQGNVNNVVTLSADLMTETLTVQSGTLISGHTVYAYSSGAQDLTGNVEGASLAGYATVGSTADTTPPVVVETNPPANLTNVPPNVSVQIELSKEVSDTSTGSVQLLNGSTPVPVTMTFSRLSTVLTLTPNVPLAPNTAYTISILGVQDITGNTMSGTTVVSFTTGSTVRLNHPNLATGVVSGSVTPCCSQTGVSPTTAITIAFDSPMDPLTFDTVVKHAALELTSTQAIIPTTVSFSPDFKTVTLTPSSQLDATTSYDVVVNFGFGTVTDMAGNSYNGSFRTSFTTGP